jgi:hypothetical protein
VRRHPVDAPAPAGEDAWLVAVATDRPAELVASVPVLDLDDACEIEGFVLGWLRTGRAGERAAAGPVEVMTAGLTEEKRGPAGRSLACRGWSSR